MDYLLTCTGNENCGCFECGTGFELNPYATGWEPLVNSDLHSLPVLGWDSDPVSPHPEPAASFPPPPPVLQRYPNEQNPPAPIEFQDLDAEDDEVYNYLMPINYSQNQRSICITLPGIEDEIFVLVVPEGVGAGDRIFFTLPQERNGVIKKEMVTHIDHCQ